jgi:hypothetical protein
MKKTVTTLAAITVMITALHGENVNPSKLYLSTDEVFAGSFSDNSAWRDESMTFELGTFTNNVPSLGSNGIVGSFSWEAANPETVLTKWVDFGDNVGAFDGTLDLMSNNAPFTPGAQLYIWGYSSKIQSPEAEWILLTNPSWKTPTLTSGIPLPGMTGYLVNDPGTVAVGGFGTLNLAAKTMSSVSVIPEPSTYALFFGTGILAFFVYRRFRK